MINTKNHFIQIFNKQFKNNTTLINSIREHKDKLIEGKTLSEHLIGLASRHMGVSKEEAQTIIPIFLNNEKELNNDSTAAKVFTNLNIAAKQIEKLIQRIQSKEETDKAAEEFELIKNLHIDLETHKENRGNPTSYNPYSQIEKFVHDKETRELLEQIFNNPSLILEKETQEKLGKLKIQILTSIFGKTEEDIPTN